MIKFSERDPGSGETTISQRTIYLNFNDITRKFFLLPILRIYQLKPSKQSPDEKKSQRLYMFMVAREKWEMGKDKILKKIARRSPTVCLPSCGADCARVRFWPVMKARRSVLRSNNLFRRTSLASSILSVSPRAYVVC